jgi:hypothetical protein
MTMIMSESEVVESTPEEDAFLRGEHEQFLDDLALIEAAGDLAIEAPLTDVMRDNLKRRIAAKRDKAMLGESGYDRIDADYYPTPPENVDCLLQYIIPVGKIWEPACGKGDISERLMDFGYETWSSDLYDHGYGTWDMDFLAQMQLPYECKSIITNPPYADGLAEKFVRHALKLTQPVKGQVAMFLRNEFDAGKGRMDLFSMPPFHKKIVVTKRPRWIEGSTGSPRHNYAWYVWDWRHVKGAATIAYAHPDFAPGPQ